MGGGGGGGGGGKRPGKIQNIGNIEGKCQARFRILGTLKENAGGLLGEPTNISY